MLNFQEKILVAFLFLAIVLSAGFWGRTIYHALTIPVPKFGGEYVEGVVGQPIYINPLISNTSEADADLVSLIYSGLFKYDGSGKIQNDLAESHEISEDKKTYTIRLKKGIKWHDEKDLTADDVVFTVNLIKDPAYNSMLRYKWQGVDIERMDDFTVKFTLSTPYFGFLENNLTVGILPKHIWQEIPADRFSLAERNMMPIGSGPYMFSDFQKDSNGSIISYELSAFKLYYKGAPYISKIVMNFYKDEDSLIEDFNKKEVSGMNIVSPSNLSKMKSSKNFEIKELVMPRYFSLFLNQSKSVPLAYDEVRKALSMSLDRKDIVDKVLKGKGFPLYSPILPQMNGFADFSSDYAYDVEGAKKILDDAGWKMDEAEGIRKKDDIKLAFTIVTTEWPQIAESAELMKSQWGAIGAKVEIEIRSTADFQQNYIKTREYDSVFFGQELNFNPDLYQYFHSDNKRDPGLNLASFENKEVDELLLSSRQELDESKRAENYRKIADIIKQKNPVIFLYGYYYLYPVNKTVKGIDAKNINYPSSRFSNVNEWYIKTKRISK